MSARAVLLMAPDESRETTAAGLRERRIDVETTESLDDVTGAATPPDVAVVEVELTGLDGGELCSTLRASGLPGLIALSDPQGTCDAAELLHAGADDVVMRPVSAHELIARVRSLLRRLREYRANPAAVLDLGDVTVDCERHEVTVRGRKVDLTPKEFELLRELARGAGELVGRDELLERVWGCREPVTSRTLDVHVGRLRKKIEADPLHPRLIVTVPRVGYRIAA